MEHRNAKVAMWHAGSSNIGKGLNALPASKFGFVSEQSENKKIQDWVEKLATHTYKKFGLKWASNIYNIMW